MKLELANKLLNTLNEYKALDIENQIDYKKFYLYSIITHSTIDSRESESLEPFRNFMFEEHIKNLVNEIKAYKKSQDFDPLTLS